MLKVWPVLFCKLFPSLRPALLELGLNNRPTWQEFGLNNRPAWQELGLTNRPTWLELGLTNRSLLPYNSCLLLWSLLMHSSLRYAASVPVGTHASPRPLAQLCLATSVSQIVLQYADNVTLLINIYKYTLRTTMVVFLAL